MRAGLFLTSLCLAALAAGCTTYVPLHYTSDAPATGAPPTPLVSVGAFEDKRGVDIDTDWLGAIRGGFGNPLKKLRTQQPMSQVVQDAFADGLRSRGLFADSGQGKFLLEGTIEKLDCSEYFNLEAHAQVDLRLLDSGTHALVFSWPYRVDETEGGLGAGIFASVETLRVLAERTLRELVDRALDDPPMRRALQTP
jgi:hypothetical protein